MAQSGRLPDTQSYAPRARGTDLPRGEAGRSESVDQSQRGNDQARRRRLLHSRALLSVAAPEVPAGNGRTVAAPAGHAHGRTARGDLARADPKELRLHALHRRPRPRWTGVRSGDEEAVLWSV